MMQHPRNPLNNQVQLGVLVIVVLKGRHLPDKHTTYKQSPYVKLSLSDEAEETVVDKKGGQQPFWDSELRFPIYANGSQRQNRILLVEAWARESKNDDLLGSAEIDISTVLRKGEFDEWILLNTMYGVERGQVYLEMTFFSMGIPPPSHFVPQQRQQSLPSVSRPSTMAEAAIQMPIPTRSSSVPNPYSDPRQPRKLRKYPPPPSILEATQHSSGIIAPPVVNSTSPRTSVSSSPSPQQMRPPPQSALRLLISMPFSTPSRSSTLPPIPGSYPLHESTMTVKDLPQVPAESTGIFTSLTTALMDAGTKVASFSVPNSPTTTRSPRPATQTCDDDWVASLKNAVGAIQVGNGWMNWGNQKSGEQERK